jgi:hypothetical protein
VDRIGAERSRQNDDIADDQKHALPLAPISYAESPQRSSFMLFCHFSQMIAQGAKNLVISYSAATFCHNVVTL